MSLLSIFCLPQCSLQWFIFAAVKDALGITPKKDVKKQA
jgi:hypothetical protein